MKQTIWHRTILLVTLAAALGLRLVNLGAQSFWYDETVSAYLSGLDLPAMIAHTAGDIHPPLYYALLHVWGLLAGRGQFALLFPSVVCSVLVVALVYRLARRLPSVGANAALLAAVLAALSPLEIWYAQELRMYTLGAALGLVVVYCGVGYVLGWPRRRLYLTGYALVAAIGLYTLYYFAFLLIFVNVFVLAYLVHLHVYRFTKSANMQIGKSLRWCAAQLAVLALYLPWLPVAWRQATDPPVPPWRSPIDLGTMLVDSWSALALGQSVEPPQVWPLLLLFGGLALLGLWTITRRRPATAALLAGYTATPVGLIVAISFVTPLFHPRYAYLYAAGVIILLALGLDRLRRISRPALLAVLLMVVAADVYALHRFHTDTWYASDDWRGAVSYVAERWRPGDAVLINAGYTYPAFVYYYDDPVAWRGRLVDYPAQTVTTDGMVALQTGSIGGDPNLGWGSPTSDFYATTEAETATALDVVFERHPHLWVLRCYDTVTDPDAAIRRWLNEHGLLLDEQPWTGRSNMVVQLYRTHRAPQTRPPADMGTTLLADFGGVITLLGGDLPAGPAHPGEAVYPVLVWQSRGQPRGDVRVFVQLVGDDGRIWFQDDEMPQGPLYPSSQWAADEVIREPRRVLLPPDLPPGRYEVRVGAYLAGADRRLIVQGAAAAAVAAAADTVTLGTIQVTQGP
ncbi:MAG: glycosyltransferase family 39 protein [Chloroflexi bacterium]|nr:glycosyltransferase family 39 protein [Chloroflexota bacterium]MBU1746100.1 glycosyltransferase family 39 protein [Chloroflexota bacterium]